jgi:hypothetical protein
MSALTSELALNVGGRDAGRPSPELIKLNYHRIKRDAASHPRVDDATNPALYQSAMKARVVSGQANA